MACDLGFHHYCRGGICPHPEANGLNQYCVPGIQAITSS